MPFGSFNKKSQTSNDNRAGASDQAVIVQTGGFIFNPGRNLANDQLLDPAAKTNWVLIGAVAVAVGAVVFLISKK